jgi:hypothetical protein
MMLFHKKKKNHLLFSASGVALLDQSIFGYQQPHYFRF